MGGQLDSWCGSDAGPNVGRPRVGRGPLSGTEPCNVPDFKVPDGPVETPSVSRSPDCHLRRRDRSVQGWVVLSEGGGSRGESSGRRGVDQQWDYLKSGDCPEPL